MLNQIILSHNKFRQKVIIKSEVVKKLKKNNQTNGVEVGGQLFGKLIDGEVHILYISGPRKCDVKKRFSFIPNRFVEKLEIKKFFLKGLHYLGDWHTHPEKYPKPSNTDIQTMSDCFIKSNHSHNFFLLFIVGNGSRSNWLWASAHNSKNYYQLQSVDC